MAVLSTTIALDTRSFSFFSDLESATFPEDFQTPTSFRAVFQSGLYADVTGEDYIYQFGFPIGTTHGAKIFLGGTKVAEISELNVTPEDLLRYRDMSAAQITKDIFKGADTLSGSDFVDYIDGFKGADKMYGHDGNDFYIVDNVNDKVFEDADEGIDVVQTSVSYTLAKNSFVETLAADVYTPANANKNVNLTGNGKDNSLYGNFGDNDLDGGAGQDFLFGNKGKDTFEITNRAYSRNVAESEADHIHDFKASDDTVFLKKSFYRALGNDVERDEFAILGRDRIDADTHLIYSKSSGTLYYDADGIGRGERKVVAYFDNKANIGHNDFDL